MASRAFALKQRIAKPNTHNKIQHTKGVTYTDIITPAQEQLGMF
jgi:hypothetical protein